MTNPHISTPVIVKKSLKLSSLAVTVFDMITFSSPQANTTQSSSIVTFTSASIEHEPSVIAYLNVLGYNTGNVAYGENSFMNGVLKEKGSTFGNRQDLRMLIPIQVARSLFSTPNINYTVSSMIDKTELLDKFQVGKGVKIGVNLRGREWVNPQGETKYFNSMDCWAIDVLDNIPEAIQKGTTEEEQDEFDELNQEFYLRKKGSD